MESDRHLQQIILLISSLQDAWRDRRDFYVAGNMAVYFSETQARNQDFRAPDLFVVLDTDTHERKSWVVWEEEGGSPDLVVELEAPWLRWIDRDGHPLTLPNERATREAERATREAERATREAERATREAERADRAEAELARLREELAKRG